MKGAPTRSAPSANHVLIVGGGTMGAGVAQSFLETGARVTVSEATEQAAAAAQTRIDAGLARSARRRSVEALVSQSLGDLHVGVGLPSDTPRLIVETVPEQLDLKLGVLAKLSAAYPSAILTTNTSALSIDALAQAVIGPQRFLGLHFFNPVPMSRLVEVVRGSSTNPDVVSECYEYALSLGKKVIVVKDSPGFATSRLGIAIGLEAMRMVEENVASIADIDAGMVLGYKFPIGPLELSDRVGLDVRLAIAEDLHERIGPRFAPPQVLRDLVARGQLGMKTGRGFYNWDSEGRKPESGADLLLR